MTPSQKKSKTLNIILWIVQVILAILFIGTGIFKLMTLIPKLAEMWPWAGEYPNLLRLTGIIDLLGGIGVVLPMLTRIKPRLTSLAALGCALLMISAIIFHFSRGEGGNTPFNFVVLGLAGFVAWGRKY